MIMSACCADCLLGKYLIRHPADAVPETVAAYQTRLRALIAEQTGLSAPEVVEQIEALHTAFFGPGQAFTGIKQHFNRLMLSIEDQLTAAIGAAPDPLRMAVQYAAAGNFIDFGAMETVDEDKLRTFLDTAAAMQIDSTVLSRLRHELLQARSLVYLTDNCGEIVADKALLRLIGQMNPALRITVIVRGQPALNDATMEDALQVGLPGVCSNVLGNGCGVAGTVLHRLPPEAARAAETADLLIAKGQGNYESLSGCGLNLFYVFMCKCQLFVDRFGVPLYSGVIARELPD